MDHSRLAQKYVSVSYGFGGRWSFPDFKIFFLENYFSSKLTRSFCKIDRFRAVKKVATYEMALLKKGF
jgi:hypothetical protein